MACSYALLNQQDEAFYYLKRSIENGFNDINTIEKDSDLYQLHSHIDWENIIESIKEHNSKTLTEYQLFTKIISLIHLNKSKSIWELCSTHYTDTTDQNNFNKNIESISKLLEKEKIKNTELPKIHPKRSFRYTDKVLNNKISEYDYLIIPNHFRHYVQNLLVKPMGYVIKIQLIEENYQWYLSKITLQNNYFNLLIKLMMN
ncbi:TPR end-of-group domain-containing protein [Aquimarina addita]|uniref:TPR end-of-group domain-containing protein n=1 Tax=Aquimarina addita TaxID=870485 RepID=UPI003CD08292